ncbi:Trefoil factor 2, partial [Haliaeetus albicilla]
MDLKVICALSVILIVSLSTFAEGKMLPTKCQCKMAPSERKNCGYPGISLAECSKAGCCFNDSVAGVPWCFAPKPKKVKKVCPNNPHARANCGFPGISAEACERKGCCFKAQPAGVPWCFYPHMVEE